MGGVDEGREAAMFMVGDRSCGGNDIRRCIWEAEV
jgi:hypothetical protein